MNKDPIIFLVTDTAGTETEVPAYYSNYSNYGAVSPDTNVIPMPQKCRMNLLKRLARRFFYGKRQPRWTDGPKAHEVLQNILAPCLRPAGDPRKMRHWYGRGETRAAACIRCGSPAPARRVRA